MFGFLSYLISFYKKNTGRIGVGEKSQGDFLTERRKLLWIGKFKSTVIAPILLHPIIFF
ncbi:hypothetical protein LEP1GSC188_2637 [Leptospira weilii serovar Topaz str. LT2116]|uniref:Uncharacterized protein n=1 Tax=Leptospira weilii serovar Topaz str. LT2116 TaxID=1088540 RepID=M3GTK9_9LEPT|nr:hypothetical protein LEP1GSC188_2637 [Leptospira weilii serovar Topaz str. LT2116]